MSVLQEMAGWQALCNATHLYSITFLGDNLYILLPEELVDP